MINSKSSFLFEVSWEVCNKVGGIYTVLSTKAKEATKMFGQNYLLIGPLLDNNILFVEERTPFFDSVAAKLEEMNIACRLGYWDIEGKPKVILIGYKDRYKVDVLLYELWSSFGVDSLAGNYEYIEPILFSTVAGEIIRIITQSLIESSVSVVAHFHEWLCGAGILHIKQHATQRIATVFTTHATVLGRALAGDKVDIYHLPKSFDPDAEARKRNVFAKHSLESAAANMADCFTTVSYITADEALIMLNKYPDKIVPNGLDVETIQGKRAESGIDINAIRQKLREIAGRVKNIYVPENALLVMTSGRYEFHNKGYDVLLQSLAQLEEKLDDAALPIVVFFLIASNNRHSKDDSLLDHDFPDQKNAYGISTHRLYSPDYDPIVKMCRELKLAGETRKIHIVYCDAYLNGSDGVFDVQYDDIIAAFDLGVFASYYEPWGYTPLECIANSTPVVTSDLAGFGCWVNVLKEDHAGAVRVLEYRGKEQHSVEKALSDHLEYLSHATSEYQLEIRSKAGNIAKLADWKLFYTEYMDSYAQAQEFVQIYYATLAATVDGKDLLGFSDVQATAPRFRSFQYECRLPNKLVRLRDIAYNLWWTWNENVLDIFSEIDPALWSRMCPNPVKFLNCVSNKALVNKSRDAGYMRRFNKVLDVFDKYCNEKKRPKLCANLSAISDSKPIAFFCIEYAVTELLQTYASSLGFFAGDFLKQLSDLNVPVVAVGLFYRGSPASCAMGREGAQAVNFEINDPNQLPIKQLVNETGQPLTLAVEVLNRSIYVSVWKVIIGRVTLYLLDSNVSTNNLDDRDLTRQLYPDGVEERLIQEMILGICGVRLITEKLGIEPYLYHLNEAHAVFLLFERISGLCKSGYSFNQACEIVKSSSVFTTHKALWNNDEGYAVDLVKKYFAKTAELINVPIETLINGGIYTPNEQAVLFSPTALAFRFTSGANAVTKPQQQAVTAFWRELWAGFLPQEIPLLMLNAGVHLQSWLGSELKSLFDDHLGAGWVAEQDLAKTWNRISSIPEKQLWEAHQKQKEQLIFRLKQEVVDEYSLRGESVKLINNSLHCLDINTLLIVFGAKFSQHIDSSLIMRNRERIAKIFTDSKRPVVFILLGEEGNADGDAICRDEIFSGHFIFIEKHDMALARSLVQGADVWFDAASSGEEICGVGRVCAGINGALAYSAKVGWWNRLHSREYGWIVEDNLQQSQSEKENNNHNNFLFDVLEGYIVPAYYKGHGSEFNAEWVERMKISMAMLGRECNALHEAREYIGKLYCPVIEYYTGLMANKAANLKELVEWRQNIVAHFSTVRIKTFLVEGIKKGKINADGVIKVKALLFSGKLKAQELNVEFVMMRREEKEDVAEPLIIPLKLADFRESGILTYTLEYTLKDAGFYFYAVRVYPINPLLLHAQNVGVVYWG